MANETTTTLAPDPEIFYVTDVQIVTVLCLLVGIVHLIMGMLRMGFVTAYLGEQVVRGFTTGAAVYVFTSQVPSIFGIKTQRRSMNAALFYNWVDIFTGFTSVNFITLGISAGSLMILILGKELINPKVKPKLGFPVPFDLIVIIIGTLLSYFLHFYDDHSVSVIGNIPIGFDGIAQIPPVFKIGGDIISDAVGVAVVIFAVAISLERLFAKKHGYFIMPDEELCAMGIVNIAISFVSCFPAAASLSRSLVMSESGTKSQLANCVVIAVVAIVLAWAGKFLTELPTCILAAIIMVALKGMFKQLGDLCSLWRLSKVDFFVWLVAFLATVCLSVKNGLIVAVLFALGTTIVRSQWPPCVTLARLPGTDLYRDVKRYARAQPIDASIARLFRFDSALMFTNAELFVRRLYEHTQVFPYRQPGPGEPPYPEHIILDCSGFNYLDLAGVKTLQECYDDLAKVDVLMLFAAFRGPARDTLHSCGFYAAVGKRRLFASVHDAVVYAHARSQRKRAACDSTSLLGSPSEGVATSTSPDMLVDDTLDFAVQMDLGSNNVVPSGRYYGGGRESVAGSVVFMPGTQDLFAPDVPCDFGTAPNPGTFRSVSRALSVPARPCSRSQSHTLGVPSAGQTFTSPVPSPAKSSAAVALNKALAASAQKRARLQPDDRMHSHDEHDERDETSDTEIENEIVKAMENGAPVSEYLEHLSDTDRDGSESGYEATETCVTPTVKIL